MKKKNENIEEIEAEIVDEVDESQQVEIIEGDKEKISKEITSLKDSLARMQADFINYKNRIEREKSNSIKLANEDLIMKILPVLDNLDRAISTTTEDDSFVDGIKLITDQFKGVLKELGLTQIESDGAEFDANFHHAVFMEERDDVESGHVIETFQTGYVLNDKVIRPAMVKVSK